ncbi:methylenetetrahydrofolate reductase C-terminal domain-containing protein, partial [Chloroflexota bacterium]
KAITAQKPFEEVKQYLDKCQGVYIIGCGTCATMCHTGGKQEVIEMKERLEVAGKKVAGWMVIPTACDELTRDALLAEAASIGAADCILVMSCAMGVQTVNLNLQKPMPVYPALNTLFFGLEDSPDHFSEACLQCGSCVMGRTAAICPLVQCAKNLLNGPCGGSAEGKCEVSPDIPCAWQRIYDSLAETGRLAEMEEIEPVKDWSVSLSGGPRQVTIGEECDTSSGEAEATEAKQA